LHLEIKININTAPVEGRVVQ